MQCLSLDPPAHFVPLELMMPLPPVPTFVFSSFNRAENCLSPPALAADPRKPREGFAARYRG